MLILFLTRFYTSQVVSRIHKRHQPRDDSNSRSHICGLLLRQPLQLCGPYFDPKKGRSKLGDFQIFSDFQGLHVEGDFFGGFFGGGLGGDLVMFR